MKITRKKFTTLSLRSQPAFSAIFRILSQFFRVRSRSTTKQGVSSSSSFLGKFFDLFESEHTAGSVSWTLLVRDIFLLYQCSMFCLFLETEKVSHGYAQIEIRAFHELKLYTKLYTNDSYSKVDKRVSDPEFRDRDLV